MMKLVRICNPSRARSIRINISTVFLFSMAVVVFLTAVFQANSVQAQQLPSMSTQHIATPVYMKTIPDYSNALIILIEQNPSQSFSVSWSGMSSALRTMATINLIPKEVRNSVDFVQNNLRTFLPQTNFTSMIEGQLRTQVAQMTKAMVRTVRMQYGLPDSGCFGNILNTLGRKDLRVSDDIYRVFIDTYGESGLANCLREMALPYYDHVEVLTDRGASFQSFRDALVNLDRKGYTIDVLMDVHGCGQNISMNNARCGSPGLCFYNSSNPSNPDRRNALQLKNFLAHNGGKPFKLNAIYMVSCWGSEYNQVWSTISGSTTASGGPTFNGPSQRNYYVLLSPLVFLDAFTRREMTLKPAADLAYNVEKTLLNGIRFTAEVDLRADLNRLLPIRYVAPKPCGVTLPVVGWVGLKTRIDYRGNKDYCTGQVGTQKFDFQKSCPVGYTMVAQKGSDKCKQDILGPLRDQAHWKFDLGPSYGAAVDKALATQYGAVNRLPVDNRASSQRILLGDRNTRPANVCRKTGGNYCFGAVGNKCSGLPIPAPQGVLWGCIGNHCVINAGSFEHDVCCDQHKGKDGKWCGDLESAEGKYCRKEWDKAQHRTLSRLSWKRRVDTCEKTEKKPGEEKVTVNHEMYCAPAGTIVAQDDAVACCNKKVRGFNYNNREDQSRAKAQGVILPPELAKILPPGIPPFYIPAVCE
jgi:hypothetical protein